MDNTLYFFDDYCLDAAERRLSCGQRAVSLTPKAFETLLLLVENSGRVVSKDLLLSKVWPETFIEENNLAVHISVLRKTLAGDSDKEYIKTLPKRGYCFAADVRKECTPATSPRPRSIAILPFKVEDSNGADRERAVGLADSIITRLSQIASVAVSPTSSVIKYSEQDFDALEVASHLHVESVLSGRLARVGDRLRLNVQLIGVDTGTVLWADRIDANSTDAFLYEDIISEHLAHSLDLHLTGEQFARLTKRHTESGAAYQVYLQGRYYFARRTAESLKKALECFEHATRIDPNYALAYSGLCDCYTLLNYYSAFPSSIGRPKATAAAEKALASDDALAEAHASMALVAFWYEWDWLRAHVEFERALTLNPSYANARQWYCWYLCAIGQFEEAEKQGQLALEIDPMATTTNMALVKCFFFSRRIDDTIRQCHRILALDDTYLPACYFLGQALVMKGLFDEALAVYQKGLTRLGDLPLGRAIIAHAHALAGDRKSAEETLAELVDLAISGEAYVPAYALALIHTGLGNTKQAIEYLYKAFEERFIWLVYLKVDPVFDKLRGESSFNELVSQMQFAHPRDYLLASQA
jgi:DNA-binding winged helix-turn-helix (wHTH) protein/tetratricopeptide (TPR) repeat protein